MVQIYLIWCHAMEGFQGFAHSMDKAVEFRDTYCTENNLDPCEVVILRMEPGLFNYDPREIMKLTVQSN